MGIVLLSFLSMLLACDGHMFGKNAEEMLFNDLVGSYDEGRKHVRPVEHHKDKQIVHFGTSLITLNRVDEDKGEVELLMFDKYMWNDTRISWDPEHYSDITELRVPISYLWAPDIMLYNSLEAKEEYAVDRTMSVVYSSGLVLWVPRAVRKIKCGKCDKGILHCHLKYGSWTFNGFQIGLDMFSGKAEIDVDQMTEDKNFHICHNKAEVKNKYYDCCKEPYPLMKFKFQLVPKSMACNETNA